MLWRAGRVLALVFVAGRGNVDADEAFRLAGVQQGRIVAPTPLAPADNHDRQVPLDHPRLGLPVWWLGDRFPAQGPLPELVLEDSWALGQGTGWRAAIDYRLTQGGAGVTLGVWRPRTFARFKRTRLGRLVRRQRCAPHAGRRPGRPRGDLCRLRPSAASLRPARTRPLPRSRLFRRRRRHPQPSGVLAVWTGRGRRSRTTPRPACALSCKSFKRDRSPARTGRSQQPLRRAQPCYSNSETTRASAADKSFSLSKREFALRQRAMWRGYAASTCGRVRLVNETWVPIGESWLGHRPEPLIHERVWACPLTGRGPFRGAFDAQGRAVGYRQDEGYEERTTYESGRIVVRNDGRVRLETELDGDGRPVRTRYASGEVEHYRYEDDRLVEIDEAPGLLQTAISGERAETGGRLRLEYDERGLCAIRGEHELVWERRDEPWPELLARGAAEIAEGIARAIERVVEEPGLAVVRLALTYVEEGGLYSIASLGLDGVRADARHFWYPIGVGGGIEEIDGDVPDELDRLLLREAALNDPGRPQRTVLNAVASALARRDWAGVIAPTDDFVAFIAEHDEGIAPKRQSLRAVNPPERATTWESRFPPSAHEY